MITRTLLDFIQRAQAKGTSWSEITATLKRSGWDDNDIDLARVTLNDLDLSEVPAPKKGDVAMFCELVSIVWKVYLTRWKRFLGVGFVYVVVVMSMSLALFMFALPVIPLFKDLVFFGNVSAAFSLAAPYLFLGCIALVLVQLWFVSTLYAVALKRGESILERCLAGIAHLPLVLGIKIVISILLMIAFVPVLVTTFLTQNLLVFILFAPLFVISAGVLLFLLSLSLPAYFHGVAWREAPLHSIKLVLHHWVSILISYILFGIVLALATLLFRETGPIAVLVGVGVLAPMEVLFLIGLYRKHAPPESSVIPVSARIIHVSEDAVVETVPISTTPHQVEPPKPKRRPRRRTRPEVA